MRRGHIGYAVCRSTTGRELLHLMKQDLSTTACGRYSLDQILPEDYDAGASIRECNACRRAVELKGVRTM